MTYTIHEKGLSMLKNVIDKRLLALLSIYENLYDLEIISKLLKEFLK